MDLKFVQKVEDNVSELRADYAEFALDMNKLMMSLFPVDNKLTSLMHIILCTTTVKRIDYKKRLENEIEEWTMKYKLLQYLHKET